MAKYTFGLVIGAAIATGVIGSLFIGGPIILLAILGAAVTVIVSFMHWDDR